MEETVYRIDGLDCADEILLLRKALAPLGFQEEHLSFNLLESTMAVRSTSDVDVQAVVKAASTAGLRAKPLAAYPSGCACCGDGGQAEAPGFWARRGRTALCAAGGLLLAAGGLAHLAPPSVAVAGLDVWLWAACAVAGLWRVAPAALRAARLLRPDMNLLMTAGVLGAAALGDWFEAATTAWLFSLALLLEAWSMGHARRSIQALLDLAPRLATLVDPSGREVRTAVETVPVGGQVLVRPGEAIPLDGTIVQGETRVDEAPLTGESEPVFKEPGSPVFAGTVNGDGVIRVRTTSPARDTTIARIMRMVREAQSRRAAVARWVDRFAEVYTPIVMGFSLLVAVLPPLAGLGSFAEWTMRALVVLVTACPCALAVSTPVTIVAGLTGAVRSGVLIKGGAYLEAATRIDAVAFDKTGTLTEARPRVRQAVPGPGRTLRELLDLALALEAASTHPVGRAVRAFAAEGGAVAPAAGSPVNLPGLGMKAEIGGHTWYAGSPRLFTRVTGRPAAQGLPDGDAAQTLVFSEQAVAGAFFVEDTVRPETLRVVGLLKGLGVRHAAMLTGDAEPAAARVGALAGLDAVHAGLMPGRKLDLVRALRERYGRVAMVGDGVNDAPALAAADLGVAMGAAGSGAALETADIALMSDDLTRLPWLIRHARRTLSLVRANIVFSLAVKAVFVGLALTGMANLWMAVAADTGTLLLVVANGLRACRPAQGMDSGDDVR